MNQKVEVDAEAIRTIVQFFSTKTKIAPFVVKGALVKMAEALNALPVPGIPFVEGWKVKPKTGRNYLRGGMRAYGEAMIVSACPFVVISLDGKHVWEGLETELFDVYYRMEGSQHDLLMLAYDDYMKQKGA